MLLLIFDGDEKKTGKQKKKVVYFFPPQLIKESKIELNQLPVEAEFEIVPLVPEKPAPAQLP